MPVAPRHLRFTRALIVAVGGPAITSALLVEACSSTSTKTPVTQLDAGSEDDTTIGFNPDTPGNEIQVWSDAPFDDPADGVRCTAAHTPCTRTCRCPAEDAMEPELADIGTSLPVCASWGEAQWNACYAIPGGPLLPPELPRKRARRRQQRWRGASPSCRAPRTSRRNSRPW